MLHICIIEPGEGWRRGGGGGGGGGEVWGGGSMPQQGLASHIKHLTQNAKCGTPMLTLTISSNENGGFFWV